MALVPGKFDRNNACGPLSVKQTFFDAGYLKWPATFQMQVE